ncbi:protein C-terminal leucine carboxyl O-methyltransferase ppm1 [Aspergillus ruber CBS 135680]|uniref:Leucine carboxyl methyltransferase 1 n=1 Tax=Aspergillus ruber (strain CBS 135680) TaxID=1388766 RepID=A0A017SS86_ASPRC|nr:leucine carboxyl methyltransferase [Aspergillus ruber CBS 135680]EYE99120.1 leucine carboxyl methyltransferase [Aspergillus ruber CBS 135680]
MSAPQIPNLNSLRKRGAPGRLRSRGGGVGPDASSASKDRVVQNTDNDASVSRLSAVQLGYIEDRFAQPLTPAGLETRRFPIINRGTYVRTTAIDCLVSQFVESYTEQHAKKQIISLGAGTDTRVFRLFSSTTPRSDLVYHEIDFPANTATKIKAIHSSPALQGALRNASSPGVPNDIEISDTGDALHSPRYHIHPLDLRLLSKSTPDPIPTLQDIDPALPTLLISECCLIYLPPDQADSVVHHFTTTIFPPTTPLGLIIYEPIRPDDPFGRIMVSNLATRGIHLQTLNKYASLETQRRRLQEQGFQGGQAAADIDFIWERWVSEEEKERVAGLEMLDEMEEWKLLAGHYCVAWGWRGEVFDCWGDVQEQE